MLLEEFKNQVAQLVDTYENMSQTARNKQLSDEGPAEDVRKIVRTMGKNLQKGCWYLLFYRLCKTKGFAVVEVQTTKSVFYANHFESFHKFCTKC